MKIFKATKALFMHYLWFRILTLAYFSLSIYLNISIAFNTTPPPVSLGRSWCEAPLSTGCDTYITIMEIYYDLTSLKIIWPILGILGSIIIFYLAIYISLIIYFASPSRAYSKLLQKKTAPIKSTRLKR